ncbi:MAG TPA: hypothetical protein VNM48_20035, partial [Chloroflexota bacterium]|nr:hypothetical protein [Chloroflexota bacterium]
MVVTLVDVLPDAAGSPLLGGDQAFQAITPTSAGTTTTIVCTDLLDPSGALTFKNWRAYCYSGALVGQERLITGVDLATGTLTVAPALTAATSATTLFWLLRDFRRATWRDFANRALRTMKRRVLVPLQGLGSNVRYTSAQLPASITRPEDVIDIGTRAYPEVATEGLPYPVARYDWEDNDGSLSLVLSSAVGTSQELVFSVAAPFATPGQSVLLTDASTTTAPADWLIAEM